MDLIEANARKGDALMRMSVGRGAGVLDDTSSGVYLTALADADVALVERACDELAFEVPPDGKSPMPSIGVVRQRIHAIAMREATASALKQLAAQRESDEPTFTCWQCRDEPGGWIVLACPSIACERRSAHGPHSYAVRCPHWLRANEGAIRLHAQEAIQKAKPTSPEFAMVEDLAAGRYRYARAGGR